MRKIKLRAWTGVNMVYSQDETRETQSMTSAGDVLNNYDSHIMQFTGQLDRDGKEIYEGDIVLHGESIRFVEQNGSRWLATRVNKTETILLSFTNPTIIGNIYENSDLLTPKTNN